MPNKYEISPSNKKKKSIFNKISKLVIYYPLKIKHVLWKSHYGKTILLILILSTIFILVWNGYNINGDYPEQISEDNIEVNSIIDRYITVILYLCMGLLSGIIAIILGVESYKTLLDHNIVLEKEELVNESKELKKKFKRKIKGLRILFGKGIDDDIIIKENDIKLEESKLDESESEDIIDINEQLEEIQYIIDENEKKEELKNIMITLLNKNNEDIDNLSKEIDIISNKISQNPNNIQYLQQNLKDLKDLDNEYKSLQNKINNNINK